MAETAPTIRATSELHNHRVSQSFRERGDSQWYKYWIKYYGKMAMSGQTNDGRTVADRLLNYRLYDNTLSEDDIERICNPHANKVTEIPTAFRHYDITSKRVEKVAGMYSRRSVGFKFYATNPEATTRRETEETERLIQSVSADIIGPIELELRQQVEELIQGEDLTSQQLQTLEEQLAVEVQAQTPEEVFQYMDREHQDPAEVMANQLGGIQERRIEMESLFNEGMIDLLVDASVVFYVTEKGNLPWVYSCNPIYVSAIMGPDTYFLDESEVVVAEYRKTPSEIVRDYDLTNAEIDKVYQLDKSFKSSSSNSGPDFEWAEDSNPIRNRVGIRVVHVVFMSLRKVGFLKFMDKNGEEQEDIVNDQYVFNPRLGDISLDWEYLPEYHEGTEIAGDIYTKMQPVLNQVKDIENLYDTRNPYHGGVYKIKNTRPTSLVQRIRPYQQLIDIIFYRADVALSRDKGRKAVLNEDALPKDLDKFLDFMDQRNILLMSPNQLGSLAGDVTNMVKELNLSGSDQVAFYYDLADAIDRKAGESVGLTPGMMGIIQEREAVSNVQSSIQLSSDILSGYFRFMDRIKSRVWHALIEKTKVIYSGKDSERVVYWVDDVTKKILTIDGEMLDTSTYGVFARSGDEYVKDKEAIVQLSHAALQMEKVNYSGVFKVMNADSLRVAEEILVNEERETRKHAQEDLRLVEQEKRKTMELANEFKEKDHLRELEKIKLKAVEDRETQFGKQMLFSLGFNKDKDINNNQIPDIVEQGRLLLEQNKQEQAKLDRILDLDDKQKDRALKDRELVNELAIARENKN